MDLKSENYEFSTKIYWEKTCNLTSLQFKMLL